MLKSYIDRVRKEAQLDELLTEEDTGHWSFFIDRRTSISMQENNQHFLFSCELGPAPGETKILEEMLFSNLAGRGTMGFVLGLDRNAKTAILWHKMPLEASYEWFRNEFEDFVNNAEFWSYFVRGEQLPEES